MNEVIAKRIELKKSVIDFLSKPEMLIQHRHLCEHKHGSYEELIRNLYQHLQEHGFQPSLVLARGFKGDLMSAHPAWREFEKNRNAIMHLVIRVGNMVIDIAGNQFGQNYNQNMFRPVCECKKFWRKLDDKTQKLLNFWSAAKQ